MNTRQGDLNLLEQKINEKRSRISRKTLDSIYRQSRDKELERLRKLYIEALKRKEWQRAGDIKKTIEKRGEKYKGGDIRG